MSWHTEGGQATVEAAFLIPVLFTMILMLLQPGIILYDRMVMEGAAAEGCRMLVTASGDAGMTDNRCRALVRRHLGAIPQQDLFHVHRGGCSYEVETEGDEHAEQVSVTIRNKLEPLPLIGLASTLAGATDGDGLLTIEVKHCARTQPSWAVEGRAGIDPETWVTAREEDV